MTSLSLESILQIERGTEGVPEGPWSTHMDDYTLHVERSNYIPDNYTLALCATGVHAHHLVRYLAHVDPTTVSELCRLAKIGLAVERSQPVAFIVYAKDSDNVVLWSQQPAVAEQALTKHVGARLVPVYAAPPSIPADVAELVRAARNVAFEDQSPHALKALDRASEAFADRVPWEDEPLPTSIRQGAKT